MACLAGFTMDMLSVVINAPFFSYKKITWKNAMLKLTPTKGTHLNLAPVATTDTTLATRTVNTAKR